ncbi:MULTISPECIES: GntR family transcriptional regulator [Micrococcaceae]|uniref:GntR family transcriptional regulator n=1 Tax=unclassified Kocuria TaxID=2649579 RepID=UPI001011CDB8|nr:MULTISPECIES: GntR family transcriptional regulator [unclassified Kocuria]
MTPHDVRAKPKYVSLAADLETEVISALEPHQALPTERDLQERYDVSRATVRRAIGHLVASGAVYAVRGSGTYVADPSLIRKDLRLTSFSQDMAERGHRPTSEPLGNDVVRADADLAVKLRISEGEDVGRVYRLRLADGAPMAIELSFIPLAVLGGHLPDPNGSLDRQLAREGHRAESARQAIRAVNLSLEEANLLSQPVGAAALRVERIAFDAAGTPVETTETTYRADRYGFDLTVVRTPKD